MASIYGGNQRIHRTWSYRLATPTNWLERNEYPRQQISFLQTTASYDPVIPEQPSSVWTPVAFAAAISAATLCAIVVVASASASVTPSIETIITSFSNWDGRWYHSIASEGYTYHPGIMSPVAFFPLYPLLAATSSRLFGTSVDESLVMIANSFVVIFTFTALSYFSMRLGWRQAVLGATLYSVFPTTFFFRMAYTESLFVTVIILAFIGIEKRWPLPLIAALFGLSTSIRSVGVCGLPVIALLLWNSSATVWTFARRFLIYSPIATAGLLGYMCFLYYQFGDPLLFIKAQDMYYTRLPLDLERRVESLLSFEPIWAVYVPTHSTYWRIRHGGIPPLFSIQFANPLYFVFAVFLTLMGYQWRWLTQYEAVLSSCMLAMTYVTRGFEMGMNSQGRFMSVVFPVFLVLTQCLSRSPKCVLYIWIALSVVLQLAYVHYFCSGRFFV